MRKIVMAAASASLVLAILSASAAGSVWAGESFEVFCDKQGDTVATKWPGGTHRVRYQWYNNSGFIEGRNVYNYGFRTDTAGGARRVWARAFNSSNNMISDLWVSCR